MNKERVDPKTQKRVTATKGWKGKKILLSTCSHCHKDFKFHMTFLEFCRSSCPHCKKRLVKEAES